MVKEDLATNVHLVNCLIFSATSVLKTGDSWEWDVSDTYCAPKPDSIWMTCAASLSGFHYFENNTRAQLNQVHSINAHFSTNSSFSGKVWFDNWMVDEKILWDFNDSPRPYFSVDTYSLIESGKVKGLEVVFPNEAAVGSQSTPTCQLNNIQAVRTIEGVQLSFEDNSTRAITIYDMHGRKLYDVKNSNVQDLLIPVSSANVLVMSVSSLSENKKMILAPYTK